MTARPTIPLNVQRTLWAESGGFCMNPECRTELISDDHKISIAEMAHIEPHSEGGGVSAENLILLCSNCHKTHEPVELPEAKEKLRTWKSDRRKLLKDTFAVKFNTFDELSAKAKPLLLENQQIFSNYGPHTNDPEAFKLWEVSEQKIIINNAKLKLMFENNLNFFPNPKSDGEFVDEFVILLNNHKAIEQFIAHVDEFEMTRDGFDGVRQILFPDEVLSIFGIEKTTKHQKLEYDVAKIQKLIGILKEKGFEVKLDLSATPTISIDRNGEIESLSLEDRPRVKQLLFTEHANKANGIELEMKILVFFYKAVLNTGYQAEFEDITDLTTLTVNGQYTVKILYSYEVSIHELQSLNFSNVTHIINLYHWNGGKFTSEAEEYAGGIGVKATNQKEFLAFCYKKTKS